MINSQRIFQYGNQLLLNKSIKSSRLMNDLEQFENDWNQYNQFKPFIQRQGLCVINEDGVLKQGPALNSLLEWNHIYGTSYTETDFNVTTPVYDVSIDLQDALGDILEHCGRTHILRIPPGGYFPPHRDCRGSGNEVFRLLMAIKNTDNPGFRFMLEDKPLHFNQGELYAVNTMLEHTLFNASTNDAYWLVVNAILNEETVDWIERNLAVK